MKIIVAGSRDGIPPGVVSATCDQHQGLFTELVSGTARGVDRYGEEWASRCNVAIKRFPAEWDLHGKTAGFIRNRQMAEYADALILIWNGTSHGSSNMRETMLALKKPVFEVIVQVFEDHWIEEKR